MTLPGLSFPPFPSPPSRLPSPGRRECCLVSGVWVHRSDRSARSLVLVDWKAVGPPTRVSLAGRLLQYNFTHKSPTTPTSSTLSIPSSCFLLPSPVVCCHPSTLPSSPIAIPPIPPPIHRRRRAASAGITAADYQARRRGVYLENPLSSLSPAFCDVCTPDNFRVIGWASPPALQTTISPHSPSFLAHHRPDCASPSCTSSPLLILRSTAVCTLVAAAVVRRHEHAAASG